MDYSIPKLRTDLEIFQASYQGKRVTLIKDALGLIRDPVILENETLGFLSLIDGKRNIQDIQLELVRQKGGLFVSLEEVKSMIEALDKALLLDSEYFRQQRARVIEEFTLLPVRPAFHAGASYPGTQRELKNYLDSLFLDNLHPPADTQTGEIKALIAPHIDLEIGKKVYTAAYQSLRSSSPRKIILLGTGHSLQEAYFSLSEKNFESPLGSIKTDKDFVRRLIEAGGEAVSPNDIAHRKEHSLEFQLVFLQYILGSDFALVPILCGSFGKDLQKYSRPTEIPGVSDLLRVLKGHVRELGKEVLVVAGVDFSHVGPKFGHSKPDSYFLEESEKHDRALLKALCDGNINAFWEESKRVQDRYNVCGFSALACLLEVISPAEGKLLDYSVWREEATRSAVSFAALVFHSRK